eukprot:scaffold2376_cov115-Isochrysis_galbana.AAC.7
MRTRVFSPGLTVRGRRCSRDVRPSRISRALHRSSLLRAKDAFLLHSAAACAAAHGEAAHVAVPRLVARGDLASASAVAHLRWRAGGAT